MQVCQNRISEYLNGPYANINVRLGLMLKSLWFRPYANISFV